MSWSALVVWLHVLFVFWLVTGVLARDRCFRAAGRTDDLGRLGTLVELGGVFERTMVRPGTGGVFLLGLLAAWMRGWPILGFLQGASVNWVLAAVVIYLSIIPVIVFVFVPRGKRFRAAFEDARQQGSVTPRLRAALADPVVRAARVYEMTMIVVITALMVTRAF